MGRACAFGVCVFLILAPSASAQLASAGNAALLDAASQPPAPASPAADPARLVVRFTPELLIGGSIGGLALALGETHKPATCGWCTPPALDSSTASTVAWSRPGLANGLSFVTGYGIPALLVVYPRLFLGDRESRWGDLRWQQDLALVAESWGLNASINEIEKHAVARKRPDDSDNVSFYSGHTSDSFAMVFAVYEAHHIRGDPDAGRILMLGVPSALATGYLRMAADKHYLSDVLTGAAVGTGIGLLVPQLHKKRGLPTVQPAITSNTKAIFLKWLDPSPARPLMAR